MGELEIVGFVIGLVGKVLGLISPSSQVKVVASILQQAPDVAQMLRDLHVGNADDSDPLVQELKKILAAGDEAQALIQLHPPVDAAVGIAVAK